MRNARVNVRYSGLAFAMQAILATCRSRRLILVSLGIPASLLSSTLPGFSIAQENTRVNLPADIRNAIVRIGITGINDRLYGGSGTVIHVKPADGGWWLCVLTADHVVGNARTLSTGFRGGGFPRDREDYDRLEFRATRVIRGPYNNNDNTWVDLAMLGVLIRDANGNGQLDEIPNIPNHIAIAAPPNNNLVAAGYGDQGRRGQLNGVTGYFIVHQYGTFENGRNTWRNAAGEAYALGRYRFTALRTTLDFTDNSGDAYILSGDSGGPSLQLNGNDWILTGVHSGSQGVDIDGDGVDDFVAQGFLSTDVRLANYTNWINNACAAVPEPFSLTALCTGLLGLLLRRRKHA